MIIHTASMSDNEDNLFDDTMDGDEMSAYNEDDENPKMVAKKKITIKDDSSDSDGEGDGDDGDDINSQEDGDDDEKDDNASYVDDDTLSIPDDADSDDGDDDGDGANSDEDVDSNVLSNAKSTNKKTVATASLDQIPNDMSQVADSQQLYEDDDDGEDPDETYLQKFDNNLKENYVNDFHPEIFAHNYEEVSAMSKVVRDQNNNVVDPLHRTFPVLTKYERTRVLGQRTKQLNNGARPYVNVPENIIDGHIIAQLELEQKRIPFIIRRPLPGNSGSEYWPLKELEIINI